MRQMGAAVVPRDGATLRRIGPTADGNTPGREMTLMRLAVDGRDARLADGSAASSRASLPKRPRPDASRPLSG